MQRKNTRPPGQISFRYNKLSASLPPIIHLAPISLEYEAMISISRRVVHRFGTRSSRPASIDTLGDNHYFSLLRFVFSGYQLPHDRNVGPPPPVFGRGRERAAVVGERIFLVVGIALAVVLCFPLAL
jgi:hypothetical protein